MNKRKWVERAKTLAIVLLAASAAILLVQIAVAYGLEPLSVFEESATQSDAETGYAQAAKPIAVCVTGNTGARSAAKYDSESVSELYSGFSAALAEALGSAGEPVEVTEQEWREALSGAGVFFEFYGAQPLRAVACWLGTEMSTGDAASASASLMCLSKGEDEVLFYYLDNSDEKFYQCDTLSTLNTDSVTGTSDARFAFEDDAYSEEIDPYTLYISTLPQLSEVSVRNPVRSGLSSEALLDAFGMNGFVSVPYTEAEGTLVYVGNESTLRVATDGLVTFRQTGSSVLTVPHSGSHAQIEDIIDAAYRLTDEVTSPYRGADTAISLTGIDYAEGSYVLHFDYQILGICVGVAQDTGAAEITVSGSSITKAEIYLREYSVQEGGVTVLPEKQAAALCASDGGGKPALHYIDSGESVSLCWVAE
jgi:hypothetical protein